MESRFRIFHLSQFHKCAILLDIPLIEIVEKFIQEAILLCKAVIHISWGEGSNWKNQKEEGLTVTSRISFILPNTFWLASLSHFQKTEMEEPCRIRFKTCFSAGIGWDGFNSVYKALFTYKTPMVASFNSSIKGIKSRHYQLYHWSLGFDSVIIYTMQ